MADEVTITGSLYYSDSLGVKHPIQNLSDLASVTNKRAIHNTLPVLVTEVAIPLGSVTAPGWAMFKNLDATNFIELRVGTGGAKFAKLKAGESAGPFRLGSGAQMPYAIADTGTCQLEYVIIDS